MRQPGDRAPAPGRLALVQDLINTADLEAGRDRLRTVDQVEVFCVDHGLGEIGAAPADLEAVRDLREALRGACGAHAGLAATEPGVATLRERFAGAPLTLEVDAAGSVRAVPAAGLSGARLLTAHVAAVILGATADRTWRRLKACASPPCRWAYYDHSPGARGRWCSMSVCGSRAKMRTYRSHPHPS
jgi:predicted RNA-binding Zn ribbon-like protein